MQSYTGGQETVTAEATNIRRLVDTLESKYPGIRDALMSGDRLKPDVAVAVDGNISTLGAIQPLAGVSEVVFLPAIKGG